MRCAEFRFTSTDGLQVACTRWDGREPVRGVLQIAHGMGEHVGRYLDTIDVLTSVGLTVYGNDHRGHGRTAVVAGNFGDFGAGGFDLLVEDLNRLSCIAKDENPDPPFILLGHSMGSFAAQQYVLDHSGEIDALILSGSGALDGLAYLTRSQPAGTNNPQCAVRAGTNPFDWLSRDDAVVDAFISDPLCFAELRRAAFASFLAAAPRLADLSNLRRIRAGLPIYLLSGSDDPVGQQLSGVQALVDRYRAAGIRNIAHHFYPRGRHEMLNEINRDEVRAHLLDWIAAVLANRKASPAPVPAFQTRH
jgi:alpha-beta hydrolase superfamily lysophospholipase